MNRSSEMIHHVIREEIKRHILQSFTHGQDSKIYYITKKNNVPFKSGVRNKREVLRKAVAASEAAVEVAVGASFDFEISK